MAVPLRLALPADLPGIVTLMNAAFRGIDEERGWCTEFGYITGDRTSEALLLEEMAAGVLFLVSERESKIIGCVSLKCASLGRWYLGSLAVAPQLQNAGFGRQLLEAAEVYAAAHGASVIEMTVVNVRDGLVSWYERRGYRRTGEIRPFPYEDQRFGTPLRADLAFVVLEKQLSGT